MKSENTRNIYSVSHLSSEIKAVIDGSFPLIWVEGEISNLAKPRSGHLYFSLKDSHCQIRCAMFRNKRLLLRMLPENGDKVLLRAKVSMYESRGDLQLIVEHVEAAGAGDLQRAFEALKQKLAAEGLFAQDRKISLPSFPQKIGIVTSPGSAAVRDVLHVLARRFPAAEIIIYPTTVQGEQAPREIVHALNKAMRHQAADLLILTRGGGSLEDLMAFNDEAVARKIVAMSIPVVSAIGHEVDFTIADFVADMRAPTPSAAAEICVPESTEISEKFDSLLQRLRRELNLRLSSRQKLLDVVEQRLQRTHPLGKLQQQQQRLDELNLQLERSITARIQRRQVNLRHLESQLHNRSPRYRITNTQAETSTLQHRLERAVQRHFAQQQSTLATLVGQLHALSPLAVLARGFSVTRLLETNQIILDSKVVQAGDQIETRFATGTVTSRVETTKPE